MIGRDFDTRSRQNTARASPGEGIRRYLPQAVVSAMVIVVLAGGAFYAARGSEGAPQVVFTASLEEVVAEESEDSLKVDVNSADVEELDELPEVGPSTAEGIIEYRQSNGPFRAVEDLEEVPGIGPKTIEKIVPFATV